MDSPGPCKIPQSQSSSLPPHCPSGAAVAAAMRPQVGCQRAARPDFSVTDGAVRDLPEAAADPFSLFWWFDLVWPQIPTPETAWAADSRLCFFLHRLR